MNEYQYYEFLALDRPLTEKQRAELQPISSWAEIKATRFVNEYDWGDLKGDPLETVERYFDAFLHWKPGLPLRLNIGRWDTPVTGPSPQPRSPGRQ
jgi:hypothetical protein